MLTEQQLLNLWSLKINTKFDKLLSDAINVWEKENFQPEIKNFGIRCSIVNDTYTYMPQEYANNQHFVCLIGACLVNKPAIGYYETITSNYNISDTEVGAIISGFDLKNSFSRGTEAYNFGWSVNTALFRCVNISSCKFYIPLNM